MSTCCNVDFCLKKKERHGIPAHIVLEGNAEHPEPGPLQGWVASFSRSLDAISHSVGLHYTVRQSSRGASRNAVVTTQPVWGFSIRLKIFDFQAIAVFLFHDGMHLRILLSSR